MSNIKYLQKDLTTVIKGVIANGCNAKGVMGSGLALALKNKWPQIFEGYKAMCDAYSDKKSLLGATHFVTIEKDTLFVGNLFTQENFGPQYTGQPRIRYADCVAIEKSLLQAVTIADGLGLPLYMPKIGCLRGGLDWKIDVLPIVEKIAKQFPKTNIYVCDI